MTAKITYLGDLRTQCTHLQSNTNIITDAPTDNNGKGEAFSPTDLLATALGSCMITIMAIKANELKVDLTNTTIAVNKIMQSDPRKINTIEIAFELPITTPKNQEILEKVAMHCPVLLSLHSDIQKKVTFNWV